MSASEYGFTTPTPFPKLPPLVFFNTSKQQTRLAIRDQRPVIELEDKHTGEVKRYRVTGDAVKVQEDYKSRTGLVDIGNRKGWLYTKGLFHGPKDLEYQVRMRLEVCDES